MSTTTAAERHDDLGPAAARSMLLVSAVLFGSMFVPGQRAVEELTPAGAVALRFLVATAAMLPASRRFVPVLRARRRDYLVAGVLAGTVNGVGFLLQSLGLQRSSASTTAFLSSLFVVFVPVLMALLSRRLPSPWVIGGMVLAVVGSFLLTGAEARISAGDLFSLGAALAASVHIVLLGRYATRLLGVPFNLVQIAVVVVVAGAAGLAGGFGKLTPVALACVVYCGLAQAAGLSIQVVAQRFVDPASSALVLLLIPVVGAGLAVVLLGDAVTALRLLGAGVIVAAVVVAEIIPLRRTLQEATALVP